MSITPKIISSMSETRTACILKIFSANLLSMKMSREEFAWEEISGYENSAMKVPSSNLRAKNMAFTAAAAEEGSGGPPNYTQHPA